MIIDPNDPKPGIPVKKGTIGAILLLLFALAFFSALFFSGGISTKAPEPTAEKPKEAAEAVTGNPAVIDEESRSVTQALEIESRRNKPAPSVNQATSASTPVIPADIRRPNADAALAEGAFKAAGMNRSSTPAGQVKTDLDKDVEIEVGARTSKSLVLDFEGGSVQPSGNGSFLTALTGGDTPQRNEPSRRTSMSSTLPGLEGLSQVRAPSAAMGLNAGQMASLRAAQGGGTGASGNADRSWLSEYGAEEKSLNKPIKSYKTASRYTLHEGKVIPAVLGKEINSDLPGDITAYTTVDIYDSFGNGDLLMPKGTGLRGRYSSGIKMGQKRVLFAFHRAIMPNGVSFDLPAAQGTDLAGASGVTGNVDNHFLEMFASSFFIAWTADKVAQPSNINVYGGQPPPSPAGQVLVDVGRTVLDRQKNIPPTITVAQGTRINIEVKQDMEFTGPYNRRSAR